MNVAEIEVTYTRKPGDRVSITSSRIAAAIFHKNWKDIDYRETFKVLYLDRRNQVLAENTISIGVTAGALVDAKLIFQGALMVHASHIILAHNHPAGSLEPSHQDKMLTNKLVQAAQYLDMKVLDHLILTGGGGWHSMADNGQM